MTLCETSFLRCIKIKYCVSKTVFYHVYMKNQLDFITCVYLKQERPEHETVIVNYYVIATIVAQ